MSLTNSQPESPETTSLREGLESSEGLRRLGRMAAIASLDRNLENEDASADRDARLNDAEIYGAEAVNTTSPPGDEEMRITAARDVIVHQPPPPPAPAVQPKSKRHSILKGAAVATALMVGTGGGAAAVAIPWLLGAFDKSPPPVVAPPSDEWTDRVLENYVPPQGGVP